jgi:hypothetical protein
MEVKNVQLHRNIPFDQYLVMPGLSFSTIKMDGKDWKPPSPKMQLGTFVHAYINEPDKYNYDNIDVVRPAAIALKKELGALINYMEPEIVVTADFLHQGFILKYKGRIDNGIFKRIVVDFKVSSMPLQKSVPYFDYENQLSGYALGFLAKVAVIIRVDPESCKGNRTPITQIYNVPIKDDWWNYQILQKGVPL